MKTIYDKIDFYPVNYAKNNGARFVEAYPVDRESPSYRFMGKTQSFREAGFNFVKKAGSRRNVMVLDLLKKV